MIVSIHFLIIILCPNVIYTGKCVTPKFYSKYEGQIPEPDPVLFRQVIEKNKLLRERQEWPETSNQWF